MCKCEAVAMMPACGVWFKPNQVYNIGYFCGSTKPLPKSPHKHLPGDLKCSLWKTRCYWNGLQMTGPSLKFQRPLPIFECFTLHPVHGFSVLTWAHALKYTLMAAISVCDCHLFNPFCRGTGPRSFLSKNSKINPHYQMVGDQWIQS